MIFNNRSNLTNSRGKSVGNKAFSYTGVRFFEPKFMENLNSIKKSENTSKASTLPIKPESKILQKLPPVTSNIDSVKEKNTAKEKQAEKENQVPTTLPFAMKDNFSLSSKQSKVNVSHTNTFTNKKAISPLYPVSRVRGLQNIGNTCYMNSILQCLLNLSKFNAEFSKQAKEKSPSGMFDIFSSKKAEVATEYSSLVKEFTSDQSGSSLAFTPSKLKSAIGKKNKRFMGTSQQDAQEFFTAFLQITNQETTRITQKPKYVELDNDPSKKSIKQLSLEWWSYNKKRDNSIICDTFQGQLISTVTCKTCLKQSVTFDNYWGMPLSISGGKTHSSAFSIGELLEKHWNFQSEIQDYYCSGSECKTHRVCLKKIELFRLPDVLVIQLKRFEYGKNYGFRGTSGTKEKIKTPIKLTDGLNLQKCVNEDSSEKKSAKYKLTSMVHHYGQIDFGHYTASVFKESQTKSKWYLMNDSKTSETVPDSPSSTVYLLFYERQGK